MKKLTAILLSLGLTLALTGCGAPTQEEPPVMNTTAPTISEMPTEPVTEPLHPVENAQPMHAISLPKISESLHSDDGVELLYFSYPSVQILLESQEAADEILADLQGRISGVITAAGDLEALARETQPSSTNWSPYFIEIAYTPTRLDQAVLSLFGNQSVYSGGPHPSTVTDSVTYDLQTGETLYLDQLLTPECTPEQLGQKIVDALASQADNLYYDYPDVLADRFSGDLHSLRDWYFSKSGLCFHFAPYDIAPYSSGTIVAEIPYSELTGILNEKFLPSQTVEATGSMYAEVYLEDDSERFTTMAHIELPQGNTEVLLYSDAPVTDIRIETGFQYSGTQRYITGSVVFAADLVDIGDAIHLSADLSDQEQLYRLVYHSEVQEYSAFITYDDIGDAILLTNG